MRASEQRVRVPKLMQKPFNGGITNWTMFWDSFKSAIHENSALSEIDKSNYLKSLLERSAREWIAGLNLTTANYQEAVSILQKHLGTNNRCMEFLLNLDPVTSPHHSKKSASSV